MSNVDDPTPARVTPMFIAAGGNRVSHALDWAHGSHLVSGGVVAYPTQASIGLYSPSLVKIVGTLIGHSGRVNCVRWVRDDNGQLENYPRLVSCATDGTVKVWRLNEPSCVSGTVANASASVRLSGVNWICEATLEGHSKTVSAISVRLLRQPNDKDVCAIVSTSADLTLKSWVGTSTNWSLALSILLRPSSVVECLALTVLPENAPRLPRLMLITGGVDCSVTIYLASSPLTSSLHSSVAIANYSFANFVKVVAMTGHGGWVRCLDTCTIDDVDDMNDGESVSSVATSTSGNRGKALLIASGSQDKRVRLWRIGGRMLPTVGDQGDFDLGESDISGMDKDDDDVIGDVPTLSSLSDTPVICSLTNTVLCTVRRLSSRGHLVKLDGCDVAILLDSVLTSHDGGVTGVRWSMHPPPSLIVTNSLPLLLLTCSVDRSMIVWTPSGDADTALNVQSSSPAGGVWIPQSVVGEVGAACPLGFVGCCFGPQGNDILCQSHNGSFHLWTLADATSTISHTSSGGSTEIEVPDGRVRWIKRAVPSGHCLEVPDCFWAPTGAYFCSVSFDQSARVYAPWQAAPVDATGGNDVTTWMEIARPQIHGYSLTCGTLSGGSHRLITGADEKVVRIFYAPKSFIKTLRILSGIVEDVVDCVDRAEVGTLYNPLGLTNKALLDEVKQVSVGEDGDDSGEPITTSIIAPKFFFDAPPFEEDLLQSTLWPETHKLYGHGHEIVAVAAGGDGPHAIIAASCKAQSAKAAVVRFWDGESGRGYLHPLEGHTLTVSHIAFSPDVKACRLVTASRDRHFAVYRRCVNVGDTQNGAVVTAAATEAPYQLLARVSGGSRIIWSVAWHPSASFFITGSRDKTVRVWSMEGVEASCGLPSMPSAVTAVDVAPWPCDPQRGVVAIGMECGGIQVWGGRVITSSSDPVAISKWVPIAIFPSSICHGAAVRRVSWCPITTPPTTVPTRTLTLATCGDDHAVRLFRVQLQEATIP